MLIIAANQDNIFARLCGAMGQAELADHDDYKSHVARGENQLALDAIIGKWTTALTCAQLEACLSEHAVPFGKIYTAADMLADPHYLARGSIIDMPTEAFPDLKMQNIFPRLSETPGQVRHAGAAKLGADTEAVLTELLDLSAEQIEKLRKSGIV
jgi:formyl-CoA transferase